jgi:hypothetical protein
MEGNLFQMFLEGLKLFFAPVPHLLSELWILSIATGSCYLSERDKELRGV